MRYFIFLTFVHSNMLIMLTCPPNSLHHAYMLAPGQHSEQYLPNVLFAKKIGLYAYTMYMIDRTYADYFTHSISSSMLSLTQLRTEFSTRALNSRYSVQMGQGMID